MSRTAKGYLATIVLLASGLLLWVATHPITGFLDLPMLLIVTLLIGTLNYFSIETSPQNRSKILVDVSEIGVIFLIPTMGYLGLFSVALASGLADICTDCYRRKRAIQWHGVLFNMALAIITYCVATTCYVFLVGTPLPAAIGTAGVIHITIAGLVYYLSIPPLLIPIVLLTSHQPLRMVIKESFTRVVWLELVTILIAGLAAHLWFTEPPLVIIPAILVGIAYFTLKLAIDYHHLNTHLHEVVQQRTADLETALERLHAAQALSAREVINAVHDVKHEIVHVRDVAAELQVEPRLHESLMTVEHLVEDMLLASALKEPQFRLFPQVENMIRVITPVIRDIPKGDSSIYLISTCADTRVFIDTRRIKRVLRNILGNAFKYGASHVDIDISDAPPYLVVTIKDNGQGIEPQLLALVKQRFVANQLSDGYGIGLHAASALMARSGGWLEIDSAGQGCGTTVRLGFPRPGTSAAQLPADVALASDDVWRAPAAPV